MSKRNRKAKTTVLYIVLFLIAIITLFPLLWAVSASLRTDKELFQYTVPFSIHTLIPVEFTLDSYVKLFTDFDFLTPMINTMIVIVVLIPLGCAVNSIAAFSFATFNFRGKKVLYAIVLASFMIPFEAIAMPLYNVANGMSLVDTRAGLILPAIASGLVLFLFTQFFKDIPPSLIEAGKIDGANLMQIFLRIIVPSSVPVFITAGLMIFMDQWNAYLWPLLVARSKHVQTIQIALGSFKMERQTLWSCMYAGTIVSAMIPLALFLPFQKYFVQGSTSSGVKG
jgi:multiple sugar transport system permease protein